MTYTTTIERDDKEIKLEITYNAHGGCRGARDSLGGKAGAGPQLEPDEEPEIEIESAIEKETGITFELTQTEEDQIESELWDIANDWEEMPEYD